MAERKKGRFNIIDGIVVLVIVVIIAGAVYKFHGLDKTSKNVNMQTVTYQMKIEALRDYVFNNIKVGDTVYDYTSNNRNNNKYRMGRCGKSVVYKGRKNCCRSR